MAGSTQKKPEDLARRGLPLSPLSLSLLALPSSPDARLYRVCVSSLLSHSGGGGGEGGAKVPCKVKEGQRPGPPRGAGSLGRQGFPKVPGVQDLRSRPAETRPTPEESV